MDCLARFRLFGLFGGLVLGGGCSAGQGDSCEISTEEISAVSLIIDSGMDIRVAIDFEQGDRRGQGSSLRLCDADLLTINGQEPTEIVKASRIEYSLTVGPDADRSFAIVLDRQDQGDRIAFSAQLPVAFEILLPMDGDPLTLGQEQVVEWEPGVTDGTMHVGLAEELGAGQCLIAEQEGHTYEQLGGLGVPDTGRLTIIPNALKSMSNEPCAATYTLTRLVQGDYPEGLQRGGRVEARVERYRVVEVVPQ
jgi:hypothetical protein